MKDFSLLYGPVRTWLPVIAMAALAMIVYVNQAGGGAECDPADPDATCAEPLVGERQLLGNDGGLDVAPTGFPVDAGPGSGAEDEEGNEEEDAPSPWDAFNPSASSVPFVSLQPSPEPMTEAGEELVRATPAGGDADRP